MAKRWRGPVAGSKLLEDQFPSLGWSIAEWLDEIFWWQPLIDEQVRKLVHHYRLHPVTGARGVRRSQFMGPKGIGKSPEAAKWSAAELEGEVVFDGWDARGDPVGRPWSLPTPWIQIAAVSLDQTDNTYGALQELLTEEDGQAADALGLEAGDTRTLRRSNHRARIDKVTASAGSREGQPITFAVLDETHLWTVENGGVKLAKTLRRNVAKMGGSSLETTNAPDPSLVSVAQATDEAMSAPAGEGMYQWKPQAPKVASLANQREVTSALRTLYHGCHWTNPARLLAEMHDPDTTEADNRRFYLNEIVPAGEAAWDPADWAARYDPGLVVADGDQVALGFDGARFHDSTALLGCRLVDRHFFVVDIWARPPEAEEDWEVPGDEVDATVELTMDRFRVEMMFGDPPYWEPYLDRWAGRWPKKVKRWYTNQTKQMCWAVRQFDQGIRQGGLTHDGDSRLAAHVAHARRRARTIRDDDGRFMWDITKSSPKSPLKIDGAVAAIVADQAASAAIAGGALNKTNEAWFI